MCGRYALVYDGDELAKRMSHQLNKTVKPPAEPYEKSYNVAPTNEVPVYFAPQVHSQYEENPEETDSSTTENKFTLVNMRWGFIPSWAKNKDQFKGYATINARLEGLLTNKLYGQSVKRGKRCVIPVSGYYEWTKPNPELNKKNLKIPYYVTRKDPVVEKDVMYLAGIYDYNDNEKIHSFSIITGHAPKSLEWLHLRMPCCLEPGSQAWNIWLGDEGSDKKKNEWTQEELSTLLKPWYDENKYTCYQVSKDVGKVTNKESYLIEPVTTGKFISGPSVKREKAQESGTSREDHQREPQLTKSEREDLQRLKKEKDISFKTDSIKEEESSVNTSSSSDTPKKSGQGTKRRPNVLELLHMGKKRVKKEQGD